jgi:hypothetical protein
MNRRQDSPGKSHPGTPGFPETAPDQYGEEHYEHRQYGPSPKGSQRFDERLREDVDRQEDREC